MPPGKSGAKTSPRSRLDMSDSPFGNKYGVAVATSLVGWVPIMGPAMSEVVDLIGSRPEANHDDHLLPPEPPSKGPTKARGPGQGADRPPPDETGLGVHQAAGEAQNPLHRPGEHNQPRARLCHLRGARPRSSKR